MTVVTTMSIHTVQDIEEQLLNAAKHSASGSDA